MQREKERNDKQEGITITSQLSWTSGCRRRWSAQASPVYHRLEDTSNAHPRATRALQSLFENTGAWLSHRNCQRTCAEENPGSRTSDSLLTHYFLTGDFLRVASFFFSIRSE